MIEFDAIDVWGDQLDDVLRPIVSIAALEKIRAQKFEYVEDARQMLFELSERDEIVEAILVWLLSGTLAAYHGSRLTDEDVAEIQRNGLRPLSSHRRRERLTRALSPHPRWADAEARLDSVLEAHGKGERAGRREGQVHLTLSRSGLLNSFNHYLTHGAEFDQHVAENLLGQEGVDLLGFDGKPRIIKVAVPGAEALASAHPFFSIDDLRKRGEVPNLVSDFIDAWSYRLSHPDFQSQTLHVDSGMMFHEVVPHKWIVEVETISVTAE
ncbi:hypothetical protein [Halomonas sp. MA07-2]|uniref:hypothetical protein n=1 Tax=Halomonas sp. MA07-2 TaxID=3440841 RepID=UPI003F49A929